jgi:hypothetical protein
MTGHMTGHMTGQVTEKWEAKRDVRVGKVFEKRPPAAVYEALSG